MKRTMTPTPERPKISAATWIKLPVFWTISAAIVAGPYFAIVYAVPLGLERVVGRLLQTVEPAALADKLNPGYWIAVALYLMLADVVTPKVDMSNLGLFGGMWINNPFSREDDFNRMMLWLGLVLMPGKFVVSTLKGTIALVLFPLRRS